MALKISENKGTLYLKGSINTTTTQSFIMHVKYHIEKNEHVILNIDNVKEIDSDGLRAIKTLWKSSLNENKNFSISGYGSKDIYDDFYSESIA